MQISNIKGVYFENDSYERWSKKTNTQKHYWVWTNLATLHFMEINIAVQLSEKIMQAWMQISPHIQKDFGAFESFPHKPTIWDRILLRVAPKSHFPTLLLIPMP